MYLKKNCEILEYHHKISKSFIYNVNVININLTYIITLIYL